MDTDSSSPGNASADERFMRQALDQAFQARSEGEVPVGAVIVHRGAVFGRAYNQVERLKDPTAHAEMIAITQAAAALGDWRLTDCVLYVTKEPCPMCAGAVTLARIARVVFGAPDPQGTGPLPGAEVRGGVLDAECRHLLQSFFQGLRRAAARPPDPAAPAGPGSDSP